MFLRLLSTLNLIEIFFSIVVMYFTILNRVHMSNIFPKLMIVKIDL